jgi:hypothetical protein
MNFKQLLRIQEYVGILIVLILVGVTVTGILAPRVEFTEPPKEDLTLGYSLLSTENKAYVLPSTAGGFLYDSTAGFVYINGAGQHAPIEDNNTGVEVNIIDVKDTISGLELETMAQGAARGYYVVMFINVMIAIVILILVECGNLGLGVLSKTKSNREPIKLPSSWVVIVTVLCLGFNLQTNGTIYFREKAQVEPSVFYMPVEKEQAHYSVETPLGVLEFGDGQVVYEGEEITILSDTYMYDGHVTRSVNPISSEDIIMKLLVGFIWVSTTLYTVIRVLILKVRAD